MSESKGLFYKEIYAFLSITVMILLFRFSAFAENKVIELKCDAYEFDDGSQYRFDDATPNGDGFFYGQDSLGVFSISGDIGIETTYNSLNAYEANGKISFNYAYDGRFLDDSNKDN